MGTKSLVCGIGVNDANYVVHRYKRLNSKRRKVWSCPFYNTWSRMIVRCYGKNRENTRPTYIGCEVCSEWLIFSNFQKWMTLQDWEGKELDKDLLYPGNKVYSPATCIFVDGALNRLFTNCEGSRSPYPAGVSFARGKYRAHYTNISTGKYEHIGYFESADEAHEAWRVRKHATACWYADKQSDPRLEKALRERFSKSAMVNGG